MKRFWILVVSVLAVSSCVPMKLSTACQAQIDQCLKTCPEPPTDAQGNVIGGRDDSRTQCEKNCQDSCR